MIDDIYEPLSLYRDRFKDEYAANASAFFEDLVKRSGVDENANRATVAVIRDLEKQIASGAASRSRWQTLRGLTITLVIASVIVAGLSAWRLAAPTSAPFAIPPVWLLSGLVVGVAALLLLVKKLNPAIRALSDRLAGLEQQRTAKTREAWDQLAPLNRLYDWDMITRLIQKTTPRLAVDPFFSRARLGELHDSFGWSDDFNADKSVLFAQSGELNGNPFVLAETLDFAWGDETYQGTLLITWEEEETYTDANGRAQTRWVTRTQTLVATVTKPKPFYSREKFVLYGNEAAPGLHFSRRPTSLSRAGKGLIDKWRMGHAIGKLEKLSRNLDDKSGFTVMANREFDALFGAVNRDDEIQFRLLFTPLAQQQMVALLKDQAVGYGDDFHFVKSGMINLVQPGHLQGFDITAAPDLFKRYDIDEARRFFNTYANDYFRHFFFALAPLLNIPLYQQHRSHDDIYKDVLGKSASFWEHESIANDHGQDAFRPPDSVTENILKTRAVTPGEVEVTAHGFRGEPRLDYVLTLGGDGRFHNVPVEWVEYLPVERTRTLAVRETTDLTREDFDREASTSAEWQDFFRANNADAAQVRFRHAIASVLKA